MLWQRPPPVGIDPHGARLLQGRLAETEASLKALGTRVQRLLDEARVACSAPVDVRGVADWCGTAAGELDNRIRLVQTPHAPGPSRGFRWALSGQTSFWHSVGPQVERGRGLGCGSGLPAAFVMSCGPWLNGGGALERPAGPPAPGELRSPGHRRGADVVRLFPAGGRDAHAADTEGTREDGRGEAGQPLEAEDDETGEEGTTTAGQIAVGHAYDKHVVERGEFPEIESPAEFEALVGDIIQHPTADKPLSGARHAFWQDRSRTVVITDSESPDGGTAFRPVAGRAYYDGLR